MEHLKGIIGVFNALIMVTGVGYLTAFVQKLSVMRIKDNVQLARGQVMLEFSIVISSTLLIWLDQSVNYNDIVSRKCASVMSLNDSQVAAANYVYSILGESNGVLSFKLIVSAIVIQYAIVVILMMQRTQKLGELIMMIVQMVYELKKFIITFGLLIGLFIIVGT
jgi:hypothetical protein